MRAAGSVIAVGTYRASFVIFCRGARARTIATQCEGTIASLHGPSLSPSVTRFVSFAVAHPKLTAQLLAMK